MQEVLNVRSKQLRKLNQLRYVGQGAADKAHVEYQRKQADSQNPERVQGWFKSMQSVIEEIDQMMKVVPERSRFRFLDLGCCPGGFTSYILDKNPDARGAGISLPVESGGHACMLDEEHLQRFDLYWGDLTRYQLGAVAIADPTLADLPPGVTPDSFDLVLIDGHPLRTAPGSNAHLPPELHLLGDRLLISQLIIGLTAATLGGTIILKASKPERRITSQLIYLFDQLCAWVHTWKPTCVHATQATFYVVGKGFGVGVPLGVRDYVLQGLMDLWVLLSYGGKNGEGRRFLPNDLDFIVGTETLEGSYAARLQGLSEHIWNVHRQSLEGWRRAQASGF
ncbi:FtsJ domain-containing protein [Mycena kentingensis (nom. inval.)]|nr:FtsJ domain-containing protein [Mycena kentingensis (nom. inval.)]